MTRAWADGVSPDVSALGEDERATLATHWRHAGRRAHASVAAYSALSLRLMALGAGPALLHAAHQAAIDEVQHARRCLSLAGAYAGAVPDPDPLPLAGAPSPAVSAHALAESALCDGCFGEEVAAREAAAAARLAGDPAVADTLRAMARDARAHAALGWQVVAFCRALDPQIAAALGEAAAALPGARALPDPAPSAAVRAHGVLPSRERLAIAAAVARDVRARLAEAQP